MGLLLCGCLKGPEGLPLSGFDIDVDVGVDVDIDGYSGF